MLKARGIKHCYNDKEACMSRQLLAEELKRSGVQPDEAARLFISPDFAQSMDESDGSAMFSPEDQKLEDELAQ